MLKILSLACLIEVGNKHKNKFKLIILLIGRLNVLANVIKKPLAAIMKEFSKPTPQEEELRKADFSFHSGDVKYHLGTSYDRVTRTGFFF